MTASHQRLTASLLFPLPLDSYFLEDFDHKTVDECATLCLNDAGCKSFDAGNPLYFQKGDCFLSYDNQYTVKPGDFRRTYQLDYYERKDTARMLTTAFTEVNEESLR